ncbi:NUDIX hydrolase [Methanosarcina sp.]|uniref:NUDIX hydrolase n=1 Tax=Methanosarcina sp. TaxID=2213 RepID=UPI0029884CC8|nr:NUDIX domain-containing protein [Methanosarcina sp.]MDW5551505.1 NUDIX domain-containing protein [Methanosarcina sp.]MDW5555407.1 NUDIX domain-containing protein [Methanosarcina sp.]MDW5560044.1 NUDIX domain-containing protein [Methanosarcina sp.]
MKSKFLLDSKQRRKLKFENKQVVLDWISDLDNGLVFENKKMGMSLKYFAIVDEKNNFQYDTFGIEEREGNCVSVVLNQKDEICLLNEYRFMPEKYFLSCPRGFSEINEDRLQCSLREVAEEVGDFEVIETIDLGQFYQNTTFFITLIGVKLVKIKISNVEIGKNQESEDICGIGFYEPDAVKQMIKEGKIECLITLGALMRYFAFVES